MIVVKQIGNDYDIIEASNRKQTFGVCLQQWPDPVLLDIIMPQKPGYSSFETAVDLKHSFIHR